MEWTFKGVDSQGNLSKHKNPKGLIERESPGNRAKKRYLERNQTKQIRGNTGN